MSDRRVWEVVGGKDNGGILVREECSLQSAQVSERLATGSLVRALELNGERMHYELLHGPGPSSGWITIRSKGNPLVIRCPPIVACFYGGGMKTDQGRSSMKAFLHKAEEAGFKDIVVLDHPGGEGVEDCTDWNGYISRLAAKLDETPQHRERPVMVVAFSHGCLGGYGLALHLGDRCLKLYLLSRRPPDMTLHEVWGVETAEAFAQLDDEKIWEGMRGAWPNPYLKDVRPLPDATVKVVATMREQYALPWFPFVFADQPAVDLQPVACPVLAIAASKELPVGESEAKMRGWRRFTTARFDLQVVEEHHMSMMSMSSHAIPLVLQDMKAEALASQGV